MIACAAKSTESHNVKTDREIIQHINRCSKLTLAYISSIGGRSENEFTEEWEVFGSIFHRQGQTSEAEKMLKRALAGYEKALEPDHPDTLAVVQNLGTLYHGRGKLDEAEKMLSRALTGYETIMDSEDKKLLDTQYILGVLYEDESRFTEAVTAFSRVSMGYGKLLGPQDPETLDALERLRSLQENVKDYVTEERDS